MENNTLFKVIRILDEYRIVINAGADRHITEQCYFQIIGANNEIIDPETKQSMGMIHSVKELVRPILIEDQFCVCEHFDDRFVKNTDVMQENQLLFTNSRKLNINKAQITTYAVDEPINVLDKAVLIVMKSAAENANHSGRIPDKKHSHSLSLFSVFFG
jgi:hypothetical protein